MKTTTKLILVLLMTAGGLLTPAARAEGYPPFYRELAGDGNWFKISGEWVWQPAVAAVDSGWRPYFQGGHWERQEAGWFWVSDYTWGAVAFHHGRWLPSPMNGWVWVPGSDWAPAWVDWRMSGDHCGWAPRPPANDFLTRIGISLNAGDERGGLALNLFTFVPQRNFLASDLTPYGVWGDWQGQSVSCVLGGPTPAAVGCRETATFTTIASQETRVIIGPPVVYAQPPVVYYPPRVIVPPFPFFWPTVHPRRPPPCYAPPRCEPPPRYAPRCEPPPRHEPPPRYVPRHEPPPRREPPPRCEPPPQRQPPSRPRDDGGRREMPPTVRRQPAPPPSTPPFHKPVMGGAPSSRRRSR